MSHGHPASGPPVDPADMRVPTGPAPSTRKRIELAPLPQSWPPAGWQPGADEPELMGPISQEELRRAAYYVTEALALGHQCDDGLAERIARLADTLAHTNGWTP